MPFVPDEIERGEPPYKKRKILNHLAMAKRIDRDVPRRDWHTDRDASDGADSRADQHDSTGRTDQCVRTSSREELIECIKRGQKTTWIPTPGLQALRDQEEAYNLQKTFRLAQQAASDSSDRGAEADATTQQFAQASFPCSSAVQKEPLERPRSALHRGDFAENDHNPSDDFWTNPDYQPGLALSTIDVSESPPSKWYSDSPRPTSLLATSHHRSTLSQLSTSFAGRRRAPSLGSSLSSSFVMRAPTSPLVHATSNPDFDLPGADTNSEPSRLRSDGSRRRTMPPNSFHSFTMTPIDTTPPNFSRPFAPALRREVSLPTHAHRPQRSLTSFTYHPRSNPHTPVPRSRRPSMTSESASRRRTSMVGSFEESILRGCMSTPPSKPLDFVAQIGVMGKGECPANLKCPAHVSVPFPAVFYSYPASTGIRSVVDDTPSPYVGTIDLNHNLKAVTLAVKKSKKDLSVSKFTTGDREAPTDSGVSEDTPDPKLHVGGAYRVPQQGQLQIVIKNPNKTAVKLFLVPYSLEGMEAGTKTFVRQRSFSTGSIMENALSGENFVTAVADPLENKHILRYLIHLKFCCPAKNRFYLYDDIRIVFANRVPDGKEKLRNEVQLPEPQFSTWKPSKPDSTVKPSKSTPSTPVVDTFEFESPQFFGDMDGFSYNDPPVSPTPSSKRRVSPTPPFEFPKIRSRPNSPVWDMRIPRAEVERSASEILDIKSVSAAKARPERALSPVTGFAPTTPLRGSPIPWRSPSSGNPSNRSFSPVPEVRDSLLSKQLRELNEQSGLSKEKTRED